MRLRATREGKRFLLAVVVVGFAALNTGNNLMYLIFSMLFSVLLISITLPYLNLRALELEIEMEEPIFVNREVPLKVILRNTKKLLPAYSVRFSLPGVIDEGIYIDKIGTETEREIVRRVVFRKRGFLSLADAGLSTSFPFIFFNLTVRADNSRRLLVYPEILEIKDTLPLTRSIENSLSGPKRAETDEAGTLREYQRGDSLKSIHWKTTAKKGKLMVRELYEQMPRQVSILLDNSIQKNKDHFEKAVTLTASLCYFLINQGYPVRLVTCGKTIPFGTGIEHLYKILDLLAVIKMEEPWKCRAEALDRGALILVLSSESSVFGRFCSEANRVYYASRL